MDMNFAGKMGGGILGRDAAGAKVWEWQREAAKVSWGKSHRAGSFSLS